MLPPELGEKDSFFLDLIEGQVLPNATIVVTSSPHASEVIVSECMDRISQHIQIMGFTEENIQDYIKINIDEDLLQDLQTYISCYPHIKSIMYNPLSAAIFMKVYKNS